LGLWKRLKIKVFVGAVWDKGKLTMVTLGFFSRRQKIRLGNKTIDSRPEAPYNAFNMGFCP
jgi:hypothetical protein